LSTAVHAVTAQGAKADLVDEAIAAGLAED
jgi:hypothetical protein